MGGKDIEYSVGFKKVFDWCDLMEVFFGFCLCMI